ncbi:hypothetical protein ACPWSR_08810 [Alloiococcus sp. CFN-8]|uniref:hypothetical protein n=1 Tax=Alloiococcus sp. CFN-8 TaxID=3416081 RepID=UPI003CEFFC37
MKYFDFLIAMIRIIELRPKMSYVARFVDGFLILNVIRIIFVNKMEFTFIYSKMELRVRRQEIRGKN